MWAPLCVIAMSKESFSDPLGWRKQWRKIWGNPFLCSSPNLFIVWMYILDHAVWEPKKVRFGGKTITLSPGQLTVGSGQISKITNIPSSTIRRIVNSLKNERLIEQQKDNKCSLITVINWDLYQSNEQQNDQRVSGRRAASERQVSTKEEYKNTKNKIISSEIILKDVGERARTRGPSHTVASQDSSDISGSSDLLVDRFISLFRSVLPLQFGMDGSAANQRKYARLSIEKYLDVVVAANPDLPTNDQIDHAFRIIEATLQKAAKSKTWPSRITSPFHFYQDSFRILNPHTL